jgi:hypothetical protein
MNGLFANCSALTSFRRAQPSLISGNDVFDEFFTKIDTIINKANQKVQCHVFEADRDATEETLWLLESNGVEMSDIFDGAPVAAFLFWNENDLSASSIDRPSVFLEVAIDVSKERGQKYFENLTKILSLSKKGSKIILNLDFSIPNAFFTKDRVLKELNLIKCYPCKSISIQSSVSF